jgi:Ankyrin repeats (3 copies)
MNGYVDTVRYLVLHGNANVEAQTSLEGLTSLHIAGRNCNLEMVKLLLKFGASIDTKNNQGRTPLEYMNQMVLPQTESRSITGATPRATSSGFTTGAAAQSRFEYTFGAPQPQTTSGMSPALPPIAFGYNPATVPTPATTTFCFGGSQTNHTSPPAYSNANLADIICLLSPAITVEAKRNWTDDAFINCAEHWS